jgi:rubredoxin
MHILTCDVCRHVFDDEEGGTVFATPADANTAARAYGWTVLDSKYLCTIRDEAHQALIDQHMPPAPVIQASGQLGIDGTEEP